ncbi:STAS domain-containing protein [Mycobacterium cookii]|nr:STAS domain-containing protein [Mycobacterium cookii]
MTITTKPRSARMRIAGDLDYETVDELVAAASQVLAQQSDLEELHLDFSELTFLDSAALSGLLLIHRRTSHSGIELRLDHRPPFLDRVLQVTGLFGHFVSSDSDVAAGDSALLGQVTTGETSVR